MHPLSLSPESPHLILPSAPHLALQTEPVSNTLRCLQGNDFNSASYNLDFPAFQLQRPFTSSSFLQEVPHLWFWSQAPTLEHTSVTSFHLEPLTKVGAVLHKSTLRINMICVTKQSHTHVTMVRLVWAPYTPKFYY